MEGYNGYRIHYEQPSMNEWAAYIYYVEDNVVYDVATAWGRSKREAFEAAKVAINQGCE